MQTYISYKENNTLRHYILFHKNHFPLSCCNLKKTYRYIKTNSYISIILYKKNHFFFRKVEKQLQKYYKQPCTR